MVKGLKFALLVSKDLPNQLKMKLQVDKNKCLGCGMCISLCPAVFELKNGKSQIKEKAALEKYKDCIKKTAENCPAGAIKERAVAQLVARTHGVREAVGSSPTSPTEIT